MWAVTFGRKCANCVDSFARNRQPEVQRQNAETDAEREVRQRGCSQRTVAGKYSSKYRNGRNGIGGVLWRAAWQQPEWWTDRMVLRAAERRLLYWKRQMWCEVHAVTELYLKILDSTPPVHTVLGSAAYCKGVMGDDGRSGGGAAPSARFVHTYVRSVHAYALAVIVHNTRCWLLYTVLIA